MEAVWGAVLSFLFVVATLAGYSAGTPPEKPDQDKTAQSDKKDDDDKKNDKKDESDQSEKSGKTDKKDKSGQKDRGVPATPRKKAEYCIKDCPEAWRLRP